MTLSHFFLNLRAATATFSDSPSIGSAPSRFGLQFPRDIESQGSLAAAGGTGMRGNNGQHAEEDDSVQTSVEEDSDADGPHEGIADSLHSAT